jgi:multidrug efflux pump subunit AcrB
VALDLGSGMGLLLLAGLMSKHAMLIIQSARQLHRGGQPERESIIAAARVRLRPILTTSLAVTAGLLPLALGIGTGIGAELQRPLAIAAAGGLLVATAFTLFVIPLGCTTLARGRLGPETAADAA